MALSPTNTMQHVSRRIAFALKGGAWPLARPGRFLAVALLTAGGMAVAGCRGDFGPEAAVESAPVEQPAIATIQDIVANPVSVILDQGEPEPAQLNQAMAYGDQIRTADQALAEVGLASGAVFRIGGDAALTLQPNQLQLTSGQMITWVEGALAEPVDIVTPAGIAGIRGTTVFVNIDDDPSAPTEIFSWEGRVAFRLASSEEEVVLNSGEQLFVSPGDSDIDELRQRVQPLDRATALERLEESPLLNDFSQPIPTRPELEATVDAL